MVKPVAPDVGARFGRLVVAGGLVMVPRSDGRNRTAVPVVCDCGEMKVVLAGNLFAGNTTSCGCFHRERASDANRTHGQRRTRLYRVWKAMKDRCYNESASNYKYYGARGITVCAAWRSDFQAFARWAVKAGYEQGLELDRVDSDGMYSPKNCRWATRRDNIKHMRLLPLALDERLVAYASANGMSRHNVIEAALDAFLPTKEGGVK